LRYFPHTPDQIRQMLSDIGVASVEQLFSTIPSEMRLGRSLKLPAGMSESELSRHLRQLSAKNQAGADGMLSFIGAGLTHHFVPAAVDQLLLRGEFFTAYTPYQPEASQGTLQAIFEYQSMMAELTGCEVVNASMYDGASAAAEALLMAGRVGKKRNRVLLAGAVHPETVQVCRTYLTDSGLDLEEIPFGGDGLIDLGRLESRLDDKTAAILVQQPNFFGCLENLPRLAELAHGKGALMVVSVLEPVSLGLMEAPARLGADIVTAEGGGLAGAPNFGGPGLGIFGCRAQHVWQMPGRLVGQTVDKNGQRGFVLTLAAREQHIRRARATSNICTNEGLVALAATIHLALLGKTGFCELARTNAANARATLELLEKKGRARRAFPQTAFFNEFVLRVGKDAKERLEKAASHGVLAGVWLGRFFEQLSDCLLISVTELHDRRSAERLAEALEV